LNQQKSWAMRNGVRQESSWWWVGLPGGAIGTPAGVDQAGTRPLLALPLVVFNVACSTR
jgi:hypothetical protein